MELIWLIVALAVLATLSILYYALTLGIGPVPTSSTVRAGVASLLDETPLPVTVPATITELGSGWGGMLVWLAQRYPTAQITGYECSLIPWLVARWRIRLRGLAPRVQVRRGNFMTTSLPLADLTYCYLFRKGMQQLATKFEQEASAGSCLVSSTFALPGFTAVTEARCHDLYRTPVYAYIKP